MLEIRRCRVLLRALLLAVAGATLASCYYCDGYGYRYGFCCTPIRVCR